MRQGMAKRYGFQPITGREFSHLLALAGYSLRQFCRMSGADERRAQRWLDGHEDIPMWVGSLLVAIQEPASAARVSEFVSARTWDNRTAEQNDA